MFCSGFVSIESDFVGGKVSNLYSVEDSDSLEGFHSVTGSPSTEDTDSVGGLDSIEASVEATGSAECSVVRDCGWTVGLDSSDTSASGGGFG